MKKKTSKKSVATPPEEDYANGREEDYGSIPDYIPEPMHTPTNHPGVCVLTSNMPDRKMKAIENLTTAIIECAKALNSTNVIANVSCCTISNIGTGPAIYIGPGPMSEHGPKEC